MIDPTLAAGRTFVVGMTGGSGAAYGLRLLEVLLSAGAKVMLAASSAARRVLAFEEGMTIDTADDALLRLVRDDLRERLTVYRQVAVESSPASGSAAIDGMVICPCSMGTLARVAHGLSTNLIERAADVALKERRRLIVVPRETPLSLVHLRNMTALAEAGGIVLPAMPGFYHRPRTVADMVDFVVARILDHLGVKCELVPRWETPSGSGSMPWDEGEE
ncbi:MAG: UbiX family flavin prenyltransferase [Planctomycetota bacterium]